MNRTNHQPSTFLLKRTCFGLFYLALAVFMAPCAISAVSVGPAGVILPPPAIPPSVAAGGGAGSAVPVEAYKIDFRSRHDVRTFLDIMVRDPRLIGSRDMQHILARHGRRARAPHASFFRVGTEDEVLSLFRKMASNARNIKNFGFEKGRFVIITQYCSSHRRSEETVGYDPNPGNRPVGRRNAVSCRRVKFIFDVTDLRNGGDFWDDVPRKARLVTAFPLS